MELLHIFLQPPCGLIGGMSLPLDLYIWNCATAKHLLFTIQNIGRQLNISDIVLHHKRMKINDMIRIRHILAKHRNMKDIVHLGKLRG